MFRHRRPELSPPSDVGALRDELTEQIDTARTFTGVGPGDGVDIPIALRAGERMFCTMTGAVLVETRRGKGHWQGATQGVSVRVPGTKSMRYRIGATKGTFVPGDESPAVIDEGTFTVTDARAVFVGAKQTREWAWSKLVAVAHQPDRPWTAIAVSNRQKTSGVGYDEAHEGLLRYWLDLAVARATGGLDAFVAHLQSELDALGPDPALGGPTPELPPPPRARP